MLDLGHDLLEIHPDTHGVVLDLLYATANNVTGRVIYARPLCLLHRQAEPALRQAVALAGARGCRLKIFDAFRPQEAQQFLWDHAPDRDYVADPAIGSNHTRGTALDLTLVDAQGRELDMGTAFDEMHERSHHFRRDIPPAAQANRQFLLEVMEGAGFAHIPHEWWHYALPRPERYPLVDSAALGALDPMRPA